MNTNLVDSERLDLPSASDAYARRRCLGRYKLIQYLKRTGKLVDELMGESRAADGRYAGFGNRVHAAWAGVGGKDGEAPTLEGFEGETLEKLCRLEALLVTDWAAGREVVLFAREQRLWLHQGITPLHSGRYDVAYVTRDGTAMLIIDGKTLMHPVAPADTNDQLRELVALARFNFPSIRMFSVAIVQPHVERSTSMATYDVFEAELALRLLRWHLTEIEQLDLPRIYGDWCRYCPAMEFCPEARAAIEPVLAYQLERNDSNQVALPVGPDGATFLRRLLIARDITETLLAAYKTFLAQNPDDLPGWTLKPGKTKRTLSDVRLAYEALQGTISLEEFLGCANVSVTKLQSALGSALGLKGKLLRDAFNARLDGVIDWKTDAPQLEDTAS